MLQIDAAYPAGREKLKFNAALISVLDRLATDLIESTQRSRALLPEPQRCDDIRRAPSRLAGFSDAFAQRNAEMKRFLFKHIYNHPAITEDRDRSVRCLEELFVYYLDSPGSMPASHEESGRARSRGTSSFAITSPE